MATDKKAQVLLLDPSNELVFKGPFNDVTTANLSLRNPSNKTVLFKVKTTAPKQYCVRPNSGVLDPDKAQTIAVMLQPSADLSSVDKAKHKFMVQSMYAPEDFVQENLDQLWKSVSKNELMDSKLKCSFVEEEAPQLSEKAAEAMDQRAAPTDSGEGSVSSSVKDELFTSVSSTHPPSDSPATEAREEPIKQPVIPVTQPTAGSTPAHIATTKETEKESAQVQAKIRSMQDRMDQLTAENNQLKSEANKLRQRFPQKPAASATIPASSTQPPSSSPLNIIAILLILVALVLGYLVGHWL